MSTNRHKTFQRLHNKIIALRPKLIKEIAMAIKEEVGKGGTLDNYKVVWHQLQNIASPKIKEILEETFPGCKITIAESKSTYPDIKMEYKIFVVAIDIKSNESDKEPWYDIARLDTVKEERLDKYDEEYELVVKYDSKTKKLIKIFFETMRDTVGIRKECKG